MNIKRCFIILTILCFGFNAAAIDFLGPPKATLQQGQPKFGLLYHYSENDLLVDNAGFDGLDISRYYAVIGYGLTDRAELYTMLGASNVEQNDIGFSSSAEFAYGLGAKFTLYQTEKIDWGLITQMSWFQIDDSASVTERFGDYTFTGSGDVDMDAYELQIAFGPTLKMDGWLLYGGAFFYNLDGDLDAEGSLTLNGNPVASGKVSADLEEDSNVGGFMGITFDLADNLSTTAEFAATGDSWGIGANLIWTF